ncbi:MAG TPA: class I SAM-dependent methyltransferase [Methanomassiliicoccales archaeon]|nr:class I SAM-dependent methyltransferase [Methanomassiliicoccales archaeon]
MENSLDPKQRFSGRASSYARARPGYPLTLFDHLFAVGALRKGCEVADLGSGTGILTELLLKQGLSVFAVEPNSEMREVAESRLSAMIGFHSVAGSAERTTLAERSVDAVTAGQAFHWFDIEPTRAEIGRILRPGGQVIMVWNNREKESDPFNNAYSLLVDRYARGKDEIDSKREDPQEHFYPSAYHHARFHHSREHDLDSLECLITSASYMPKEGDPGFKPMIVELRELFKEFQVDGKVVIRYVTDCYHGGLDEA